MGPKKVRYASANHEGAQGIDWEKCCLCYKRKGKLLRPSCNNDPTKREAGYRTLANNLTEFKALGELPSDMALRFFNNGEGLFVTLLENSACWHKSCFNKYSSKNIQRAKVRAEKSKSHEITLQSHDTSSNSLAGPSRVTRSSIPAIKLKSEVCFICDSGPKWNDPLRNVSTFEMDKNIRELAQELSDTKLLSTLGEMDLIAQEGKYHCKCLTELYNRRRKRTTLPENAIEERDENVCEAFAFAYIVSFMSNKLREDTTEFVFKMGLLVHMYSNKLSELQNTNTDLYVYSTRLRGRILAHFPQLRAEKIGKEYVLLRDLALPSTFHDIPNENVDEEAISWERLVRRLRKDIREHSTIFRGSFEKNCQRDSVPSSLLAVVNYLIYGSSEIKDSKASQPALTIAQLILFNFMDNAPSGNIIRHRKSHEPPLATFLALSTYKKSRSVQSVDEMHQLGLSISPKRLKEINCSLAEDVVQTAKEEGFLCPRNLRRGIFTVAAYDNIDHNLSSTTSQQTFHGTGISLFQFPTSTGQGEPRVLKRDSSKFKTTKLPEAPEFYSVVKAAVLRTKEPPYPKTNQQICKSLVTIKTDEPWLREHEWLEQVNSCLITEEKEISINVSWAAFHANRSTTPEFVALRALLPLFYESSTSVPMIKHGMDIVRDTTRFLNENQQPVIVMDQPLFALAKIIQWNWPSVYGEDKFVVCFAPFHIEQGVLRVIGDFLEDSGWVAVISNSGIATETGALSHLTVKHLTKARLTHQVTAAALYSLLKDAYKSSEETISFNEWMNTTAASSPTFQYWLQNLKLVILLLKFLKSIRVGDFSLFMESLKEMVPWFFLFDHVHYARWLTVHLKDLEELPKNCPEVYSQFSEGNFVIRKTRNNFSALAIDQAHEQHNADVKQHAGAIGILQDPGTLMRWSLTGPEIVRLLSEFETTSDLHSSHLHHEQYGSFQTKFLNNVRAVKESFLTFGNPFCETSEQLIKIDDRTILPEDRSTALRTSRTKGVECYKSFIMSRLVDSNSFSIFTPIKKNGFQIFAKNKKVTSKQQQTIGTLRFDVSLFSKLFIACQTRKMDLDNFFSHENQIYPPSLSVCGEMRTCTKADLTHILEGITDYETFPGTADAAIYDGAAIVNSLPPKTSRTFGEYASEFNMAVVNDGAHKRVSRIDLVWDIYNDVGLKKAVQFKRGTSLRRQVSENQTLPKNWPDFLRNSDNKEDLFLLLAKFISRNDEVSVVTHVGFQFIATENAKSSLSGSFSRALLEADSRLILHAYDAVRNGAKSVVIRTVDTDVLVIAVSYFFMLKRSGLIMLWVDFGVGKYRRYIAAHSIANALTEEKSTALRGFHSFTGCDTNSSFSYNGKNKAWKAWLKFDEATIAFANLSNPSPVVADDTFTTLERYVVLPYDPECLELPLNQVRQVLFTSKGKPLDNIPPTSAALREHTLRAAYQAGHIWGQALSAQPAIPPAQEWGWTLKDGQFVPKWSNLPEVSEACRELVKCGCKKGCGRRCSCKTAGLPCSLLCKYCRSTCNVQRGNEEGVVHDRSDDSEEEDIIM